MMQKKLWHSDSTFESYVYEVCPSTSLKAAQGFWSNPTQFLTTS